MAAGAIPPPLFFERRRHVSLFAPIMAVLGNIRKTQQRRSRDETAGALSPTSRDRSALEDI
jgi:hypothetical protein